MVLRCHPPDKSGAYSWVKSPRYDGQVYEVGPLARMVVSYVKGDDPVSATVKQAVDGVLAHFSAGPAALFSVLGRHAARALECQIVADEMAKWVLQLQPGQPTYYDYETPQDEREGAGLWDGPRGALGHWMKINNGKIVNYQCVVPTTWNGSPR
ncbi:MAG: nickel-dependent hydrogenase large subunit, partial [Chloroflexi bacterium]|nr:nickel-dependent hydrogenase large subunit [Chloroflexota bacterium]